ncbi:hypothetical protein U6G28_08415 [Actinomycetaceae bacterium MB13-C1-2]|nr:hypothetical protein U6G28_08415 [Actinomycetaceae bacterium MB13-C1-2]
MRSIAKLTATLAAVSLGSVALVGCSSGDGGTAGPDCEGSWTLAAMESDGEKITENDIEDMKQSGVDLSAAFTLDLTSDGKAMLSVFDAPSEGTWAVKDGNCEITIEGEAISAPIEDGKLILAVDGSSISFKRAE